MHRAKALILRSYQTPLKLLSSMRRKRCRSSSYRDAAQKLLGMIASQ